MNDGYNAIKFSGENMLEPSILQAVIHMVHTNQFRSHLDYLQSMVSYYHPTSHSQISNSSKRDPQCGLYYDKVPLIFLKIERRGRGAVHISWCQARARILNYQ